MPFGAIAAATGLNVASDLIFGGGSQTTTQNPPPKWLKNMLLEQINKRNYTGFLPDQSAYDESYRAKIGELELALGTGIEGFNADAAARGVFGSTEGQSRMYEDVMRPIYAAGAGAAAQSNLGYAQAYQSGMIAEENVRLNYAQILTGLYGGGSTTTQGGGTGAAISTGVNQAFDYLQLKSLLSELGD